MIARGGMGAVYKARQIGLNRIVAVKMILAGELASAEEIARFQTEAKAAANLHHNNIVKIYGVGEHDGQHYFAMEYVDGKNLLQLLRESSISPKQAARYLQQIAQAIEYAHRHGVLHRDIKPSNVLIDAFDQVRVTDFGLAKCVEADSGLTASRQILGTASYMSPEQAAGKQAQVGPASDVFSLGAMFYEILTGRPPFRGATTLETLLLVRDVDPELPQRINPQVPRELAMICLKCLEKDPQRRYPSAQALADDLVRYLNGDSISIASMGLFERLTREFERSHHDVELSTWGDMTLWVAGLTFVSHTMVFLLVCLKTSYLWSFMGLVRGLRVPGHRRRAVGPLAAMVSAPRHACPTVLGHLVQLPRRIGGPRGGELVALVAGFARSALRASGLVSPTCRPGEHWLLCLGQQLLGLLLRVRFHLSRTVGGDVAGPVVVTPALRNLPRIVFRLVGSASARTGEESGLKLRLCGTN